VRSPPSADTAASRGISSLELGTLETTAAQEFISRELDEELLDLFQLIEWFEEIEAATREEAEAQTAMP
jgi:hypothetical protein